MRLVLLHQLPLEMYPPACNLLQFLAKHSGGDVWSITSTNQKGLVPFHTDGVRIRRYRFGKRTDWVLLRWVYSLLWHFQAAWLLCRLRPAAVISVEPHSALAAWLWRCFAGKTGRLLIHHHEYYTPEDYLRPGNRLTRINRHFENHLLKRADWISQTNADRLRLFRNDHPDLTDVQCHLLPNYPPYSWQTQISQNQRWPRTPGGPLRLVYVGSVSLHDTFVGPLVEWLLSPGNSWCTLDIYCYNLDPATRSFLEDRCGERLTYHREGVDYDALPDVLGQYDVGLILYRCTTVNFVFNASNKLFEYLTCGLDVWYPPCMLGVRPYARTTSAPRVLETDFENLSDLNMESRMARSDLPWVPWTTCCEQVFAELLSSITPVCCDKL